jgi:hypothetical protein
MLKCKLWNPLGISLSIEIRQGYILVIDGLWILSMLVRSQDFVSHFFDEI